MTNLKQKRLANLNKLLMEQSKYGGDVEAEMSVPSDLGEKDESSDSFLDSAMTTIVSLYGIKGAKEILTAVIKKRGGEELLKALEQAKPATRTQLVRQFFRRLGPKATAYVIRMIQEVILALGQRGYGQIILRRLVSDPRIASFIARLGMTVLASGELAGATASMAALGGGAVAGAGLAAIGGTIIIGSGLGLAIGYGLNKLFNSPDLDKEVKERIEKANEDVNYAKAELDVYCKGTGALCKEDVECSGKPGGYEYSKADGYETWLGLGAGRELFGVPGFRTFKQTPNSFHANDGAVMVGLALALILHDQKNGLIVLPNEENKLKKAELKDGAASKEYQDCIKGWLTQSRVMLAQIEKFGLEKAYKELRFFYGIDALPELPTDKEKEAASTAGPVKDNECRGYPFVPGCVGNGINNMIAVLVRGTDEGQRLFQTNKDKIQKLADDSAMSPEVIDFIKQVLKVENPEALSDFEAKDNKINSSSDALAIYVNKLAKEKNISESILSERINLNKDPLDVIKEQRLRMLNKKLMGKIKC